MRNGILNGFAKSNSMDTALLHIENFGPDLSKFWVRSLGFSKEFTRIKTLEQLSAAERLFAALLRSDGAEAQAILAGKDGLKVVCEKLADLVRMESLACIVYERLVKLGLLQEFQRSNEPSVAEALASIRRMSMVNASNHYQLDQKFSRVLNVTSEFRDHALWVKGAHLSRTVYEPAYFRHFGDLDVIVEPSRLEPFVESLRRAGFASFNAPAYCNQLGVGPVNRPSDVIKVPLPGWIPTGAITMNRQSDGGLVDIKVGPFERGVQAIEFDRIFADAEEGTCLGINYLGPSRPDHLVIMLCNFAKNRFKTWRTLLDIHMLVISLNQTPQSWQRFVSICKTESVGTVAWVSLKIAADRLKTPIPDSVLSELAPEQSLLTTSFSFTIEPAFVWNSTSLPMMLLNASVSADRKRKFDLLRRSILPSAEFLSSYYGHGQSEFCSSAHAPITFPVAPESTPATMRTIEYLRYLFMHWYVLVMPAGFVRRTFGQKWWSTKPGF